MQKLLLINKLTSIFIKVLRFNITWTHIYIYIYNTLNIYIYVYITRTHVHEVSTFNDFSSLHVQSTLAVVADFKFFFLFLRSNQSTNHSQFCTFHFQFVGRFEFRRSHLEGHPKFQTSGYCMNFPRSRISLARNKNYIKKSGIDVYKIQRNSINFLLTLYAIYYSAKPVS